MNNFMIMQVAMEATAMPPPASTVSSEDSELTGDASFDSKLEKAMNAKPDEEALELASEAVVVQQQNQVNQPLKDENAAQTSDADALVISQKMYALIEGQAQLVQPDMLVVANGDESTAQTENTTQGAQDALTEAQVDQAAQAKVTVETPVLVEAGEVAAEMATKVGKLLTKKGAVESALNTETTDSAQASGEGEQALEKTLSELVNGKIASSDAKSQAPLDVAKGNNDPAQPDTTDGSASSKLSAKTVSEANTAEVKIDLTKATVSAKPSGDPITAQASSDAAETTKPLVDENVTTPRVTISESRKVKANLSSIEGESPPQASSGSRAIQAQELDAQVKEPARLAEARTPEMISQISKGIDMLSRADGQSLRIQLQPENLGKIEIRISSGSNGVTVSLNTDTQLTGNLLERNMSELRTSLADAGVNLASLSVNSGQQQATYQESKQWYSGKESRNIYNIQNNNINEELPSVTSGWKDSAIDYRI